MNRSDNPEIAPTAERIPHPTTLHGEVRQDDYFWLRDKSDPRVAAYLEAENRYVDSALAHTKELQESLYHEILSHIEQTDSEAPYPVGNYFYYSRTEEGKQYRVFCRRKGSLDSAEEVTLDLNAMAEGFEFFSVSEYSVSDCGGLLAYSTDTTGSREYTLQVRDLNTGDILADRVEKTGSIAWAANNKTLYYTVEDAAKRQYQVYRHVVGAATDDLVFEETDEMFSVDVSRSRSGEYLFLTTASLTATEVRYMRADGVVGAAADWQLVAPRSAMHEYFLDHHSDRFFITTNDSGRNFRVVTVPTASPVRDKWQEIIPHQPGVMLDQLLCFRNHLVVSEREDGLPHLSVRSLDGKLQYRAEFPESTYNVAPGPNFVFDTQIFRYNYESMVTPPSVFDLDVNTKAATLRKQNYVPGYEANNYESRRVFASAPDGARVPVSIVKRKAVKEDRSAPLYLYGYGSYGLTMPAHFSSSMLALLDRGFVYAIAHIRGGGELGKPWHDAGRLKNKRNTFIDFIACAEMLIAEGVSCPDRVAIGGGSAGGLLMGAVCNMRPDLFTAVISKVPFVDVINTMLDETLPLTVGEFEEWGNPKVKADYDCMNSYCPYSNLESKDYPAILVKTSFNDSQVMYWEPAKFVAKLRTLKTDSNLLLLKTNMAGGHGGSSGRYDKLRETALDYAFILSVFNMA